MRIVEIAEANATLAEYTSGLTEPVIVISNGQPVAVLVALENVDIETISLGTNPNFIDLIERSRTRRQAEGGVSSVDMRHRLGLSNS